MTAWGGWGELYHYSVLECSYFFFFFASNGSPIQNLVHTNSKLKQKILEFEMHEKNEKE